MSVTNVYEINHMVKVNEFFGAQSKSQGYAHFHEPTQSPVIQDMAWKPFYTFISKKVFINTLAYILKQDSYIIGSQTVRPVRMCSVLISEA